MHVKKKKIHTSNLVEDKDILKPLGLLNILHLTGRQILLVNDFSSEFSFDCDIFAFTSDSAQMVPLK